MGLMWYILWMILGFLLGLLAFFGGGFLIHAVPDEKRYEDINKVANHYSQLAMKLLHRAVLVERGTRFDIHKTTHDPEKNADQFSLGDKIAHVTNESGLLGVLHGYPFGIVPPPDENVATYVSPEVAEFGETEAERREALEMTDEDGNYQPIVELPSARPLAQFKHYARLMIPGNRSLFELDETVDLYRQSQTLFGSARTQQYFILVVAYGGAMLASWLIMTQGGGSVPENVVDIPMVIA